MPEPLIQIEGVSKKYCRSLKRSLWYGLQDITSELFGLKKKEGLRKDEFWAVSDVSFELKRGECLGLIGHNGAGKSTLLKMLNGLIKPDKGRIEMKGRIGALIELGAGFNPILTGRENVFNSAAVLGFSQEETLAKYQDIVEFSELDEFMDTPVQNYSSGMKVRLGFAVAAQMEPDVLIIDEVLAVGDVGFRIKCLNHIVDFLKRSSVIFVSHSMPQVAKISSSILLIGEGKIRFLGNELSTAIELYFAEFKADSSGDKVLENENIRIDQINIFDENNLSSNFIKHGSSLSVVIDFSLKSNIESMTIDIGFLDKEQKNIAIFNTGVLDVKNKTTISIKITIPYVQFTSGEYSTTLSFIEHDLGSPIIIGKNKGLFHSISDFKVRGSSLARHSPIQLIGKDEIIQAE